MSASPTQSNDQREKRIFPRLQLPKTALEDSLALDSGICTDDMQKRALHFLHSLYSTFSALTSCSAPSQRIEARRHRSPERRAMISASRQCHVQVFVPLTCNLYHVREQARIPNSWVPEYSNSQIQHPDERPRVISI